MMSALLDRMTELGIISVSDKKEVTTLYTLSSILEGEAKKYFSKDEQMVLDNINDLLKKKDYSGVRDIKFVPSLDKFKDILLSGVDIVERMSCGN